MHGGKQWVGYCNGVEYSNPNENLYVKVFLVFRLLSIIQIDKWLSPTM